MADALWRVLLVSTKNVRAAHTPAGVAGLAQ